MSDRSAINDDPLLQNVPVHEGYKVLGPVALYSKLGQGGMGAVYRGRHLRLNIDVAVKVMTLGAGLAPAAREIAVKRFLREAQTAAGIQHQNLVGVKDVNAGNGLHYLIMEYVDGESAGDRLKRKGKLPEREALEIVLGAAEGLAEAHAKGIVHRDIKPDNILITRDGKVKVADLGLAKAIKGDGDAAMMTGLTMTKSVMGTPYYMSPEQVEDTKSVSFPTDVWSLGVTLYQLLTNTLPWQDSAMHRLFSKICDEPLPDIRQYCDSIPDALVEIINKSLSKDIADRYAHCGEMVSDLKMALAQIEADHPGFARTLMFDDSTVAIQRDDTQVPPTDAIEKIMLTLNIDSSDIGSSRHTPPVVQTASAATQTALSLDDVVEMRMDIERARKEYVPLDFDGEPEVLSRIDKDISIAREVMNNDLSSAVKRLEKVRTVLEELTQTAGDVRRERERKERERLNKIQKEKRKKRKKLFVRGFGCLTLLVILSAIGYGVKEYVNEQRRIQAQRRQAQQEEAQRRIQAQKLQEETAETNGFSISKTIDVGNGIKMGLVLIPAGEFMMGANRGDSDEKPIHKVKLTQSFYMGKYEVTQEQYEAVMGTNPSNFKGDKNPVEQVSWIDAQAFCKKLSEKTGYAVTLPTEAQWEYACRAGSTTKYYFGDRESVLGEYAWYGSNSSDTHPVGQKKPNAWGLYDMHGNVWEWCQDWYGSYPSGTQTNPTGPTSGSDRVDRGGGWRSNPHLCRSADRNRRTPTNRYDFLGFRVLAVRRDLILDLGGGVKMEFVLIPADEFMMGSNDGDSDEKPVHKVWITQSFYMGKYEVTQEQYEAVMGTNPSNFKGDKKPVEQVSWIDAQAFCKKLSEKTGYAVTLPTEAQWEYACRAGTSTTYSYGDTADGAYMWYGSNSSGQTHKVGTRKPNPWGLYDMHGNVWEWCRDRYGTYPRGTQINPAGPTSGSNRVFRGGGWFGGPLSCRSALRLRLAPPFRLHHLGFRVLAVRRDD